MAGVRHWLGRHRPDLAFSFTPEPIMVESWALPKRQGSRGLVEGVEGEKGRDQQISITGGVGATDR